MSNELSFDGRVAIITGAGGGLGRSHALLLASRGAKVVVNDLGGSFKGEGKSSSAADKVVDEIRAAGGTAVANYDSVENGKAIVDTALKAFGQVDIVINNAGILRDVSFAKMTETDWELIYKVHVLGAFRVTHAAWPHMREAGYGRVIFTASAAGIYGNFGQANYSMAKLALHGLGQTLALEGRKRNIIVNTIAPVAGSRMTETVLPPNLIEALRPEVVSPLVARLAHESNEDSGGLYEVGGGFFSKLRWQRSAGKIFRVGRAVSPEDVDGAWEAISSFENVTYPETIGGSLEPILKNLEAGPSKGGNQFIDVDEALGHELPETMSSYDERDLALYALGVGAGDQPTSERDLQLLYELHGAGMKALPTYAVIPAVNSAMTLAKEGKSAPGLNYGLDRILHGEQYTELTAPLPLKAKLTHRSRIKDIFDKGDNALVVTEVLSYDEDDVLVAKNEITQFVRGAGGWGGDRGPAADGNAPPDRKPDRVIEEKIPQHQALLYRLSGDWNPLHADPGFAKAFGFDRPILHGLCTFGYAGRHVVQSFAPDGNPDWMKSIRVRFAKSVLPGDTIVTEMWKESDQRIVFRCKVKERDEVVISNAAIELFEQIPKREAKPKAKAAAASADAPAVTDSGPTSWDVFVGIRDHIERHPELVKSVGHVFLFKLENPASSWTVDVKNGKGGVQEGVVGKADCTLEIADGDFMDMTTGKSDPMKLFSTGKLKIGGNVMASQKLSFLQKIDPKEAAEAVAKARAAGEGPSAGSAEASETPAAAPGIFAALEKRLKDHPALAGDIGATLTFHVTEPDLERTFDLTGGRKDAPTTVLTLADADLRELTQNGVNVQSLYQHGKLRVDGDVTVAHRLGFLKDLA